MAGNQRSQYSLSQRRRQSEWKRTWGELPDDARRLGAWNGIPCSFILPAEYSALNLWAPIREEVLASFRQHDVAWHDAEKQDYGVRSEPGPSPHLLDSQVCALNFWCGLARSPAALVQALRSVFVDVDTIVPAQPSELLAAPEWIGSQNYLGERSWGRRGTRTTSADFLIAYLDEAGQRHGILVESKYSESYEPGRWKRMSDRGTDRAAIYRGAFDRPDAPVRRDLDIALEDLLIEPFDQHLRQQLLARAMEREHELGFQTVTCLHVAPRGNDAFHSGLTAPKLAARGASVGEAWRSILRDPSRYHSVAYEDLFALVARLHDPALDEWVAYQRARYPWGSE